MNTEAVSLFVVEDDEIDFLTIQRSLEKRSIANNLMRAKDGFEALEMLRVGQIPAPFIILLDLRMPRMNGVEFLKELRNNPLYEAYKDTVVFVLTTSNDEKDIINSYEQYIAGYFLKEQTGDGLLDIVEVIGGYWKVVQLPVKD